MLESMRLSWRPTRVQVDAKEESRDLVRSFLSYLQQRLPFWHILIRIRILLKPNNHKLYLRLIVLPTSCLITLRCALPLWLYPLLSFPFFPPFSIQLRDIC